MTGARDPVAVATGVLMERYQQDLDDASAMLRELAAKSGRGVGEFAAGLLRTSEDAADADLDAGPAVVRRAVAFIQANAHRPIGIDDIARAARIGVRGLQHAFRRHRDETPMGHLRKFRMDSAHRDLVRGDRTRGDTVGGIAERWGFKSPGRFAIEYRNAFGCSPGDVLRGEETAADPPALLARAREARRRAQLLADPTTDASIEALLHHARAESIPLPPTVEARLTLLLGRPSATDGAG
ncbi:helix-turn-helix domain-containing protein [Actinomycetospora sp. C-140]